MGSRPKKDAKREHRIVMEVVVDCYDADERSMGWCCYLEEHLEFPFSAKCISQRAVSPLRPNDMVEVIGMGPAEECHSDMFVTIRWADGDLAVPLAQLQPVRSASAATKQAIADWHYWVKMGYEFWLFASRSG